jgi:polyphosphate glucokinase
VVICLTFGTGIGSGLFIDGVLVPNTELGHLELDGPDVEKRVAASAREREGLSWDEWGDRVDHYLRHVVMLFSPELIILGGGASKKPHKWAHRLDPGCELAIATMANNAGIAGAALMAPSAGAPSVRE